MYVSHNSHTTQLNSFETLKSPLLSLISLSLSLNNQQSDMSTPYTLVRNRMKDLISCFNACKLPVDKDSEESDHPNPKPSSNIIHDRTRERGKKVKVETTSSSSARAGGGGGRGGSPMSLQSGESEEDNYIVFYFKDDDNGRDVIEERGLDAGCCNRHKKDPVARPELMLSGTSLRPSWSNTGRR
ncbi:putative protein BREAKING OF ASYMMETRY IN THE STOMATAL LINEAGE [Helianthus annuus]|nr:putative protein BREAKING OF ASYMMETRY IN THE STOMATAL LINEAGE [Helianthus annuus]